MTVFGNVAIRLCSWLRLRGECTWPNGSSASSTISTAAAFLCGLVLFCFASSRSAHAQIEHPLDYHEYVAVFCKGTKGATMGDPIDVATGAVSLSEKLGTLPGRMPFTLSWGFEAQDYTAGPLGTGTYLSCDFFLIGGGTYGAYKLITPDNRHFVFMPDGTGTTYSNHSALEMMGAKLSSYTVDGGTLQVRYYVLRWKNGTKLLFNPRGALVNITDRFGNAVQIERNKWGFATRIFNQDGRQILLTYTPGGYLSQVTLPLNRTWNFSYKFYQDNPDLLLDTVTDTMAGTTRYIWAGYTRPSLGFYSPADPTDPSNPPDSTNPTNPTNPPSNPPADPVFPPVPFPGYPIYPPIVGDPLPPIKHPGEPDPDPNEPDWDFTIGDHWYRLPHQDPILANPYDWWTYVDEGGFGLWPILVLNPPSTTPQPPTNGPATSELGQIITVPEQPSLDGSVGGGDDPPIGEEPNPPPPDPPARGVPGLLPQLLRIIDRAHRVRIINTYDTEGRVITQKTADGATLHFTYGAGATTMTDDAGDTTTWHWGGGAGYGYVINSVTNPLGETTTFGYGGANLVNSITDFRGRTTQLSWDAATGNLLSVTTPTATGNQTTSATYDPVWNVPVSVTSPLGTTSATLDPDTGVVTSSTNPVSGTTYYSYSPKGDLLQVKNALNQKTILAYTSRGELQRVTSPEGRQQRFEYDDASRLTASLPATPNLGPVGWQKYYDYNDMDQVTYTGNVPLNGITYPEFPYFGVRYDYDVEGNVARLNLPGNQKWEWDYDAMDRVIRARDPLNKQSKITYNLDGTVATETDRKNQKTVYTYLSGGRLGTSKTYKASGALDSTQTFTYSPTTHLLSSVLDSRGSSSEQYSFGYDAIDRMISETGPQGAESWTLDNFGRRTSYSLPNRPTITYSYNGPGGMFSSMAESGSTGQRASVSYDALGRVNTSAIGPVNDFTGYYSKLSSSAFTPDGQVSQETVQRRGQTLDSRSTIYDLAGRQSKTIVNGQTQLFGYDLMGSLRFADYGNDKRYTFSYDSLGNRLNARGDGFLTQFSYGQGNRLLEAVRTDLTTNQQVFDKTADYDFNGNMTRWGNANYSWSTDGELTGVSGGAAPGGTYNYDAFGRRKGQPGETIPSVWDGWSEAEPFDRDLVANKIFDPAGSLVQGVDWLNNTPIASLAYAPFGEAARTDDGSLDASGTDKAQWAGMYNDPSSGLYYARNRYYDPEIGRFISEDPVGLMGGPNVYAYCHNDPINFIDPLGLWETGSYLGDVGAFGKGELGAAANFVASAAWASPAGNIAHEAFGIKLWHPYSTGCMEAERSGEWFGDQLYAVGAMIAPFSGGGAKAAVAGAKGAFAAAKRAGSTLKKLFTRGCFVAGTLVAMADGSYKPIELIKPGDMVLARDTTSGTGQTVGKRVEQTSVRDVDGTLLITFAGGATIEATGNHPFFVAGAGFVEADQLSIGSQIVTRAGPNLVISKIEKKTATVPVYNFVVQDFHSYFVGEPGATGGGAWVHNGVPCDLNDAGQVAHLWDKGRRATAAENALEHYDKHGAMYSDIKDYTNAAQELWRNRFSPGYTVEHFTTYKGTPQIGTRVEGFQEVGAYTTDGLIRQYFIRTGPQR